MSWCSAPLVSSGGWWPVTWPVMCLAGSASGLPGVLSGGWLRSGRGWVLPRRAGRCWSPIRPIRCRWRALARAARVVVTTVGPYRARGLGLVQACAEAGTDYADLTGEVLFIRDSIDRCHDIAAGTGARIVHCCGFDSVPSDLGVLMLHQAARAGGAG